MGGGMGGHLSQHDMTESVTRRVTADTDLGHASLHSSLITELLQITTTRPILTFLALTSFIILLSFRRSSPD